MPPLISGHPRIVATVNRMMNLIVAVTFDHRNIYLYYVRNFCHAERKPAQCSYNNTPAISVLREEYCIVWFPGWMLVCVVEC